MNYRTAVRFVDDLFGAFIIFVLSLIWFRYFIDGLVVSVALAVVVSMIISLALIEYRRRKSASVALSREQSARVDDLMTYLLLSTRAENIALFNRRIQGRAERDIILKDDVIYYIFFDNEVFGLNDFYRLVKTLPRGSRVNVLANAFDPKVVSLAKNYKPCAITLSGREVIVRDYLDDASVDLSEKLATKNKLTAKDFLGLFVRPENAKGYFLSAIYILLACLIIPQRLYYVIFASVLLVLALVCHQRRLAVRRAP